MPTPLYIVGPTGSGKSSIAASLAREWDAEIVNGDAFQLYQGVPIVTAKPSAAELALAPHHLFDVLPLNAECDAATYVNLAQPVIDSILARGKIPMVVGGSGLYIKALTHGLSPLPSADPELRARFTEQSLDDLVAELTLLDPDGIESLNTRNRRYVERALEISLLTGRPASQLKQDWQPGKNPPGLRGVALTRERSLLYQRIDARVLQMIQSGLVEEIRALPTLSATAAKAIGIREIQDHLAGHSSLEQATEAIQQATRRFAKRQLNWFRRETAFRPLDIPTDETVETTVSRIVKEASRL